MFFDPTCKPEVKADPTKIETLIAWLEKMPAGDTYNWHDCNGGCLVAQYGYAMGMDRLDCDTPSLKALFGSLTGYGEVCGGLPHTFGAALDRAREFAARQS